MDRLGKHKTGKSCLYIKRLSDVDEEVLEQLAAASLALREKYPKGLSAWPGRWTGSASHFVIPGLTRDP